jgi:hypothetical protein
MKKRVISFIVALAMCLGLAVPVLANERVEIVELSDGVRVWVSPYATHAGYHEAWGSLMVDANVGDTLHIEIDPTQRTDEQLRELRITGQLFLRQSSIIWLLLHTDEQGNVRPDSEGFVGEMQPIFPPQDWNLNEVLTLTYQLNTPGYVIVNVRNEIGGVGAGDNSIIIWITEGEPQQPTPPAHDAPSAWATEQVNAAIGHGLVPQALQSAYTQATTRAEFAALAVYLYENQRGAITGRSEFADTTDVNVQKAAYIGVVQGVGDNRFAPSDTLTREQAAVMLSRLASVIGSPISEQAPTFSDNAQVSDWAAYAVGQMQITGIMGGVGENRFDPQGAYTREQSIVTILRVFDILG